MVIRQVNVASREICAVKVVASSCCLFSKFFFLNFAFFFYPIFFTFLFLSLKIMELCSLGVFFLLFSLRVFCATFTIFSCRMRISQNQC